MHVLYLTNGFPFPLTSGYLRHYYLIKDLAEQHEVDISLFSVVGPRYEPAHAQALAPYTRRIQTFSSRARGRSKVYKAVNVVRRLFRPEPAILEMRDAVVQLLGEDAVDVVLSDKGTLSAAQAAARVPLVGDMCDASSMRIRRRMRFAGPLRAPFLLLEYWQMRRSERALMQQADHLLFISLRDQQELVAGADLHQNRTVIPLGVDYDFWRRQSRERQPDTIVMTGVMDYQPNVDAALYLIREILREVRRVVPQAELFIVGRDPKPELLEAGQQPGVTVTGFVDDVRPYLERATVFVAPLRFGAGVQNKVLEAMAMEVPVITSPLVADGLRLPDHPEPPVIVADDTQGFVRAIVQQLEAARTDLTPDTAARRFVESNYIWQASAARLAAVLRDAAQGEQG